jgi:PAS domain S-box-containing protein
MDENSERGTKQNRNPLKRVTTTRTRTPAGLEQSRVPYQRIVETMTECVVRTDPEGILFYANNAFYRYFGVQREDVLGKPFPFPDTDPGLSPIHTSITALTPEQPTATLDLSHTLPMGKVRWQAWSIHAIFDSKGRVTEYQWIGQDITDRKSADQALKESEERYRTLAEAAQDTIFTLSPEGVVQYVNSAGATMLGMQPEAIIGRTLEDMFDPAIAREFRKSLKEVTTSRRPIHRERRVSFGDRTFWWDNVLVPLIGSEEIQAIGITRDSTVQKRMEDALEESKQKYWDFMNLLPQVVFEMDAQGQLVFTNRAAVQEYGFSGTSMRDVMALVAPEDRDRMKENIQRALKGEVLKRGEYTVFRDDGTPVKVLVYSTPVLQDGKITGLRGILVDITHLKQVEGDLRRLNEELEQRVRERTAELAAANLELESFTYSVAHDLRSPLRAIDGFSGILLTKCIPELPPKAQEYLEKVRANTQQMARLIDGLLDFSRLGRGEMRKEWMDPTNLIPGVLKDLKEERKGREVEISLGDLPPMYADPTMLRQVLYNLLSNALKFTRNREHAKIEIRAREQGEETVYYIRDNGVGFDMRYADKVFQVFQRLHGATEYEGTGVGLAIASRIITKHGGRIWIESEVDKGTTIYFIV